MNTVQGNFKGYTRHNIKKAEMARRLQGMIRNPTKQEFMGMVCEKLIANCPVTVQEVHNANQFFGTDLANLRRNKTTRTKPEQVKVDYVKIPHDFIKMHKYVTLVADVLFINSLPFLVTSSRGINLITIKFLPLQTAKHLSLTLEQVIRVYGVAGFIVQVALMDMEFEKLKDVMSNITINTTAAREHVREIERKIQVIKE
jgi:hypothetical protein